MIEILNFLNGLNDIAIMMIAILSMIVFATVIYVSTGSLLVGICASQFINCLNLSIIITNGWLTYLKPFMPLWMSVMILLASFACVWYISPSRVYKGNHDRNT